MTGQSNIEIRQAINDYINSSQHPDLLVYRRDLGDGFDYDRWVGILRSYCDLGGFLGKHVLEVGCGFGWDAVGLSLVGQNRVLATDILPSMIDGVKECLAAMAARGRPLDVEALSGDICNLELPERSFDGIFSSEAIEHVHDLDAMFERCARLLKPGGRILVVNNSNRYNSRFRKATFRMWQERDESVQHAEWLRTEVRPVEHRNARPYAHMRADILRQELPQLDEEMRARLAKATAGMVRSEILEAARTFLAAGDLPTPPRYSWCRNPETGEYAERLLDPFLLREMMTRHGFRNVHLRHTFTRFPLHFVNGLQLRPLNLLLFELRAQFILVGEAAA